MVMITESSVLPVGAPTTLSFVRTIVVPLSRSAWISVGPRRHSLMRVVTSVFVEFDARSVELVELMPLALTPVDEVLELGLVDEIDEELLLG